MQSRDRSAIAYAFLVLVVAGAAATYLASGKTYDLRSITEFFAPPCAKPIRYAVGTLDARFGISRAQYEAALREAAAVWNTAAEKTVIEAGAAGDLLVNLVYSEYQRNAELGQKIDAEQAAYEQKRDEVEQLRSGYLALRSRFNAREAALARDTEEYDEEVAYWNAQGGAPPAEYERLEREQRRLAAQQDALNELADEVNAQARALNAEVDELNRLAAYTNAKVGAYNKTAGTDFDQGTYTDDADGRRIDIYEFTDMTELKRVLAHEFGHALGLGHLDNPESIMYSYNIGESFALTDEDIEALRARCGVE